MEHTAPLESEIGEQDRPPGNPRTLTELCIDQLSASGCRTVFRELHRLPDNIVDKLLIQLAHDNTLTDNVASRSLTRARTHLSWEGCTMLRRSVFFEVPRRCPNLIELRLQRCKQIGNGLVRSILTNCHYLRVLRLDGCRNITDAGFITRPFDILYGLLGLRELGLSQCPQITSITLQTIVKNCPKLTALYLSQNRHFSDSAVTDILESCRFLKTLDLGHCSRLTPDLFYALGDAIEDGSEKTTTTANFLKSGAETSEEHPSDKCLAEDTANLRPNSRSSPSSNLGRTETCIVSKFTAPELSLEYLSWAHLPTSVKHLQYIGIIAPKLQQIDLRWTHGVTDQALRCLLLKPVSNNPSDTPNTPVFKKYISASIGEPRLPNIQWICLRGCSG